MKNLNWSNIWINIRLLLMLLVVVFLYSFTAMRNEHRKLKKSVVQFDGIDNQFVTRETVNKLLIENKQDASSIRKDKLDLNTLENTINKHNMIEKSEVFVTIDGVLKVVVKQKTPIARVFNEYTSFYIDYQGNKMPLSKIKSARVPLVSGEINEKNRKDLHPLFLYIFKDDFLKKNIIGIHVLQNGAIKLMNRNYDYEIDFGGAVNIEKKFKNYEAFFQKAIQDSTISKYKKINLRFTQQVVCTK